MEILKPNELKEKFSDPWIAPYEKVLTMVDGDKVELIESDAVLGEYGVYGLLDVVVGIGRESALLEHIVSVGEGFFRTDDEVSFA